MENLKRSPGEKAFDIFNVIFLSLFALVCLYPFVYILALSFNDGTDAMKGGVGLANLRRRLELLYGGRAPLVTAAEGDRYTATLIIPTTA